MSFMYSPKAQTHYNTHVRFMALLIPIPTLPDAKTLNLNKALRVELKDHTDLGSCLTWRHAQRLQSFQQQIQSLKSIFF